MEIHNVFEAQGVIIICKYILDGNNNNPDGNQPIRIQKQKNIAGLTEVNKLLSPSTAKRVG